MFVAIYTTFEKIEDARKIALLLIEEKLVACVNLIPNVHSIYPWKGQIEETTEIIFWCKTQDFLADNIQLLIQEAHPYDLPAFVVYPIHSGSEAYLKWISDETQTSQIN
ncbi:MAG: divalent-cation tolerance protein CutA [Candidatus Hodarchaeales archaeon]|jgi:periplasmic divalent cation tolerance protein